MADETNLQLDRIIRLLATVATLGRDPSDQVALLHRARFQPKEIGELLGMKPNSVSVILYTQSGKRATKNAKSSRAKPLEAKNGGG